MGFKSGSVVSSDEIYFYNLELTGFLSLTSCQSIQLIHILMNRAEELVTCKVEPMANDKDLEIPQHIKVIWDDPTVGEITDLSFTYRPDQQIDDIYPKFTIARFVLDL